MNGVGILKLVWLLCVQEVVTHFLRHIVPTNIGITTYKQYNGFTHILVNKTLKCPGMAA